MVSNQPDLIISRVPKHELSWFKEWCNENFEGDYGFGFKWLAQGYMPPENRIVMERLEMLEQKFNENKGSDDFDGPRIIKTGGGSITRRKS